MQFEPITDDNAHDWEEETPERRSERRGRLQAFADGLGDDHAAIKHQLRNLIPQMADAEDVVLHLRSFELGDEFANARVHHEQALAKARAIRRRAAERVEMLKLAKDHGWGAVKNYEVRRKTGADKDLQSAIDDAMKEKDRQAAKKREKRAVPYKKNYRPGRAWPTYSGWQAPGLGPNMAGPPGWPPFEGNGGSWVFRASPGGGASASGYGGSSMRKSFNTQQGNTSDLMCFRCGESGHTRKFCKKRPE